MFVDHLILCVDDDPDDIALLKEAFHSLKFQYRLVEAHDGIEGLKMLKNIQENGELPCLIVLDINMPRMDGRETFNAIRSNPVLAEVPVVVFSTSSSALDKMFFAKKNVEYFVKPINFNQLAHVAGAFLSICERRSAPDTGRK